MILSKEYLAEQEKCILENSNYSYSGKKDLPNTIRHHILKDFCSNKQKILSVGCSGYEPIFLNATHALDVSSLSHEILKSHGWTGKFTIGSCDSLPFENNEFDVAVCSEVIEHLPDLETVKKTFLELHRVAKSWIVTTPSTDKCNRENQYPGHNLFWNEKDLINILKSIFGFYEMKRFNIFTKGVYVFIQFPSE